MTKGKTLGGHKKRENKAKPSSKNALGKNGVDLTINSEISMDNSCAIAYTCTGGNINLKKPVVGNHSKACSQSTGRATSSRPNLNSKSELISIPNNSVARDSFQMMNPNMNIPASQYYFLTKLMNEQKRAIKPDSVNVKQYETSNSTNATTCTTTTTTPSTITNSMDNMETGAMPDTSSIDYKNNNLPNVQEPMCQCHIILDPYPSQLSLR